MKKKQSAKGPVRGYENKTVPLKGKGMKGKTEKKRDNMTTVISQVTKKI